MPDKGGSIQRSLKEIEAFAQSKGIRGAKLFPASKVIVDDRVRMKCQIPRCYHYGRMLNCPPNVPTVDEFRRVLKLYKTALLIQTSNPIEGDINKYEREEVLKFCETQGIMPKKKGGGPSERTKDFDNTRLSALKLHKVINETELFAMSKGFPFALGLIGGDCMLCNSCVGAHSGKPCRRPYESRPAIEGLGIDVVQTSINAGLPFDIPPKKEIVWTGLLLLQ